MEEGAQRVTHAVGLPPLSEKQWQRQVVELARLHRWMVRYDWTRIHGVAGYPDLTLVRPPRLVYLELKTDRGRITRAQQDWIDTLADVPGVVAAVVRPADWEYVRRLLE